MPLYRRAKKKRPNSPGYDKAAHRECLSQTTSPPGNKPLRLGFPSGEPSSDTYQNKSQMSHESSKEYIHSQPANNSQQSDCWHDCSNDFQMSINMQDDDLLPDVRPSESQPSLELRLAAASPVQ